MQFAIRLVTTIELALKSRRVARKRVVVQNSVEEGSETPPPAITAVEVPSTVNLEKVLYIVFDLVTTGRS